MFLIHQIIGNQMQYSHYNPVSSNLYDMYRKSYKVSQTTEIITQKHGYLFIFLENYDQSSKKLI